MYAVRQTFTDHVKPDQSFCKILKPRYKTWRGAEKAAQGCRRVCMPQGIKGPVVSESNGEVIEV